MDGVIKQAGIANLEGSAPSSDLSTNPQLSGQPQQQPKNFAEIATEKFTSHLNDISGTGTMRLLGSRLNDEGRSAMDIMINGSNAKEGDNLPITPGSAYATHLYSRSVNTMAAKEAQQGKKSKVNIFTDQQEALKVAIKAMGVYSERNPGGMPIEITEAKNLFFGDDDIDPIEENQWRVGVEQGDGKIDPKKVRRFVNHDGSLTWEILNDDKTVMSRFTMGEYGGTKIFAQGGHSKFSDLLKKAKSETGASNYADFDTMRDMFGGQG